MAKSAADAAQKSRGARTRQRLLEAARTLLAEGGPAAVTHRAVAETADVSLGATTYHFSSKEELLAEVYRNHLAAIQERAEDLSAAMPESRLEPAERRAQLIRGLLAYLEAGVKADRAGSLATFELALERARNPALRRKLRPAQEASDAYAIEMLGALGAGRPDLDGPLVIAALNGLRMQWLAAGERSAFASQVPALIERLADWMLQPD